MKRDEPSDYVRLAATNALLNSLEFTKANFDNEVSDNFKHIILYFLLFPEVIMVPLLFLVMVTFAN